MVNLEFEKEQMRKKMQREIKLDMAKEKRKLLEERYQPAEAPTMEQQKKMNLLGSRS